MGKRTTEDNIREKLVERLRTLADEIGGSPTVQDLKETDDYPTLHRFVSVFGSWNEAKEAAGLKTHRKEGNRDPFTDDELLRLLKELDEATEGFLSCDDMENAEGYPSCQTYKRRFGSWNRAKKLADLETVQTGEPRKYSDEELLDMLRQLSKELGRTVTVPDVDHEEGYPDSSTYVRRFGSWNKAKEKAGLATRGKGKRGTHYTDEELAAKLRDLSNVLGGQVTYNDIDHATGVPSSSTYQRRFGTVREAKKKAGLLED